QASEGPGTIVVLVILMGALAVPGLRRPDGRAFLIAVGLWAVVRSVVATTWRDPVAVGPFRTEQVLMLLLAVACLIGFVGLIRREGQSPPALATGESVGPVGGTERSRNGPHGDATRRPAQPRPHHH